jgi:hypothetical protein
MAEITRKDIYGVYLGKETNDPVGNISPTGVVCSFKSCYINYIKNPSELRAPKKGTSISNSLIIDTL